MTEKLMSQKTGARNGRGLNWSEGFRRLWNRCIQPGSAETKVGGQTAAKASWLSLKDAARFGFATVVFALLQSTGLNAQTTVTAVGNTVLTVDSPNRTYFDSHNGFKINFPDGVRIRIEKIFEAFYGSSGQGNVIGIPTTPTVGYQATVNTVLGVDGGAGFEIYNDIDGTLLDVVGMYDGVSRSVIGPVFQPLLLPTVVFNYSSGVVKAFVPSVSNFAFGSISSGIQTDGTLADSLTLWKTYVFNAVNAAPIASAVAVTTTEDTSKEVTLSAADADGNALTYSIVAGPSNGTLGSVSGDKVTYTPNANFNGTDTFTFKANDGTADSATETVTVTVNAVNDAPTLTTPTAIALTDTAANDLFSTPSTGILSGSDIESGTLTYGIDTVTAISGVVTKVGTYGTLTVTSATGDYRYAPNASAINALRANASDTFAVTISDNALSATANLVVNITGVNDTPTLATPTAISFIDTAADDTFSTSSGTLSASDRDTGTTLTYGIAGGTVSGTTSTIVSIYATLVVDTATGAYTYTPNAAGINALSANNRGGFTVTVSDGGLSNTANLVVNRTGVNDTPTVVTPTAIAITDTAADDTFSASSGTLSASDRDRGTTLTYGITGGTGSGTTSTKVGTYGTLEVIMRAELIRTLRMPQRSTR